MLPTKENKFLISESIDYINDERWDSKLAQKNFKSHTDFVFF